MYMSKNIPASPCTAKKAPFFHKCCCAFLECLLESVLAKFSVVVPAIVTNGIKVTTNDQKPTQHFLLNPHFIYYKVIRPIKLMHEAAVEMLFVEQSLIRFNLDV